MQTDQSKEKKCANCRYFAQHYSKKNTRFITVACGHCLKQTNKKIRQFENCNDWEDIIIKKEERKRIIKEAIVLISESLSELTMILKDDIEN